MNNTAVNHEIIEAFRALDNKYRNLDLRGRHDMTIDEIKTLVDYIVNCKETDKGSWYDAIIDSLYLAYKIGYSRSNK